MAEGLGEGMSMGSSFAALAIKFGFEPDKDSEKKIKQSFTGLTSLISDLAIISKIAGDALGKIFQFGAKQIKIGIEEGGEAVGAGVRGWDASSFNRLQEALEAIGSDRKQAGSVVATLDKFIKAYQNPELEFGEKFIKQFEEIASRYGVTEEQKAAVRDTFQRGDAEAGLTSIVDIMSTLGEKASNFAEALNLAPLANLEKSEARDNFWNAMLNSSKIYKRDIEKLLVAMGAVSNIKSSFESLGSQITEMLSGPLKDFAAWFQGFVENDPIKKFKNAIGMATEISAGDLVAESVIEQFLNSRTASEKGLNLIGKTSDREQMLLRDFNDFFKTNFNSFVSAGLSAEISKRSTTGAFDNSDSPQKIKLVVESQSGNMSFFEKMLSDAYLEVQNQAEFIEAAK